ncbi:hypothetical protein GA0115257_110011 [Streptomyces sp. LcepLS]|nr:hypothetical protein GA0115257_110011 [Streptomyces sp. LcepLS]
MTLVIALRHRASNSRTGRAAGPRPGTGTLEGTAVDDELWTAVEPLGRPGCSRSPRSIPTGTPAPRAEAARRLVREREGADLARSGEAECEVVSMLWLGVRAVVRTGTCSSPSRETEPARAGTGPSRPGTARRGTGRPGPHSAPVPPSCRARAPADGPTDDSGDDIPGVDLSGDGIAPVGRWWASAGPSGRVAPSVRSLGGAPVTVERPEGTVLGPEGAGAGVCSTDSLGCGGVAGSPLAEGPGPSGSSCRSRWSAECGVRVNRAAQAAAVARAAPAPVRTALRRRARRRTVENCPAGAAR